MKTSDKPCGHPGVFGGLLVVKQKGFLICVEVRIIHSNAVWLQPVFTECMEDSVSVPPDASVNHFQRTEDRVNYVLKHISEQRRGRRE